MFTRVTASSRQLIIADKTYYIVAFKVPASRQPPRASVAGSGRRGCSGSLSPRHHVAAKRTKKHKGGVGTSWKRCPKRLTTRHFNANIRGILTSRRTAKKQKITVGIAQLVRAPGCGPGGRGFESHYSPHSKKAQYLLGFLLDFNRVGTVWTHIL